MAGWGALIESDVMASDNELPQAHIDGEMDVNTKGEKRKRESADRADLIISTLSCEYPPPR